MLIFRVDRDIAN